MTKSTCDARVTKVVRRAAVRATLAPSTHNSQPWRVVVRPDSLEIHIDPGRRLHAWDPTGRQVVLSCGCALFTARVAIAASGLAARVVRLPPRGDTTLVARVVVGKGREPDPHLARLDGAIDLARTVRPVGSDLALPPQLVARITQMVADAGGALQPVTRQETRDCLTALLRPDHGGPRAAGGSLLLLSTAEDDTPSWLTAGELLQQVTLEVTRHGYAAAALPHVIEQRDLNGLLRTEVSAPGWPQALLMVGPALSTPQLRRRRLVDVLTQVG